MMRIIGPELLEKIVPSIPLKSLSEREHQVRNGLVRTKKRASYVHMVKNGKSKCDEVAMGRVQYIENAPTV